MVPKGTIKVLVQFRYKLYLKVQQRHKYSASTNCTKRYSSGTVKVQLGTNKTEIDLKIGSLRNSLNHAILFWLQLLGRARAVLLEILLEFLELFEFVEANLGRIGSRFLLNKKLANYVFVLDSGGLKQNWYTLGPVDKHDVRLHFL